MGSYSYTLIEWSLEPVMTQSFERSPDSAPVMHMTVDMCLPASVPMLDCLRRSQILIRSPNPVKKWLRTRWIENTVFSPAGSSFTRGSGVD